MKLLLENWRTFVKETEEPAAVRKKGDAVQQQTIVGMRLPDLVAKLNSNQKEVMDIMLHGLEDGSPEDDKVPVKSGALKISNLTPTQNEVVIDKSLPFTLKDPRLFKQYVSSDGPFKVGIANKNDAIITANGTYVIDGHHRWSSLFCFNPNASIFAWDIQLPRLNAQQILNATQISIYSIKPAPGQAGGGVNLFQASENDIGAAVKSYIDDTLAQTYLRMLPELNDKLQEISGLTFNGKSKEDVVMFLTKFIYSNVKKLQKKTPAPGSTKREYMPQADVVGDVSIDRGVPDGLKALAAGQVDISKPYKMNELKKIIIQELVKILKETKNLSDEELAAQYPPKDKITRGDFIALAKGKKKDDDSKKEDENDEEEDESLKEKKMSKGQMKKREKFVKGMKGAAKDFSKRYGSRGKDVMYATATKMAQKKKKK